MVATELGASTLLSLGKSFLRTHYYRWIPSVYYTICMSECAFNIPHLRQVRFLHHHLG